MIKFSLFDSCRNRCIGILVLLLAMTGRGNAADDAAAVTVVDEFHATLIAVMKDADELGFAGRYQKLQPVIESKFDIPVIAQVILGQHWQALDEQQRRQFIELFSELTIATYADRFNAYAGETFAQLQTKPLNKQRLLVQTQLTQADGETIRLDYLMHQRDDRWYIISVVAQGVNDLALKRAEYTEIIENQGFDRLLAELQAKIDAHRQPGG